MNHQIKSHKSIAKDVAELFAIVKPRADATGPKKIVDNPMHDAIEVAPGPCDLVRLCHSHIPL